MLTERELRGQLADAAAPVGDDGSRATRAIAAGQQRAARRQRTRAVVAAAAVGLTAVALPTLLTRSHATAPPTSAAVACQPGRTLVSTPRVAELDSGAVDTINNETQASVVVRLGNETAVVAPGVIEGQFPLSPGRQMVQCVSGGTASSAASLAVVAGRGI